MIILKTLLRMYSEDLIISDQDFENFVGVSLHDWMNIELETDMITIQAIANFCYLSGIKMSKLLQSDISVRKELKRQGIHLGIKSQGLELSIQQQILIYSACKNSIESAALKPVIKKHKRVNYKADYRNISDDEIYDEYIPAYIRKYNSYIDGK